MVKHYNPFRMWGSWIGAILIGLPVGILAFAFSGCGGDMFSMSCNKVPYEGIFGFVFLGGLFAIPGFLLGWGIHSLIRALRK